MTKENGSELLKAIQDRVEYTDIVYRQQARQVTDEDIVYLIKNPEKYEFNPDYEYGNYICTLRGKDIDGEEFVFVGGFVPISKKLFP